MSDICSRTAPCSVHRSHTLLKPVSVLWHARTESTSFRPWTNADRVGCAVTLVLQNRPATCMLKGILQADHVAEGCPVVQHVSQTGAKSEAGKRGKSRAREFRRIVCVGGGRGSGPAAAEGRASHPSHHFSARSAQLRVGLGADKQSRRRSSDVCLAQEVLQKGSPELRS